MLRTLIAASLLLAAAAPAASCGHVPEEAMPMSMRMTLEQRVGQETYAKAGLAKLTPEEQMVLAEWIKDYTKKITDFMEDYCRRRAMDPESPPRP
ncbi:MAG: hypothetical protein LDL07_01955 [Desulfarculus sp.]|nr:hypothetical protein [Desulfarculus sp.]